MFRLWLIVAVLTAISWVLLKLINKRLHIGWLFLFWVVVIFGSTLALYGISVWMAAL